MTPEQWQQVLQSKGLTFKRGYGNVALAYDQNGNVFWVGPTGEKAEQAIYG